MYEVHHFSILQVLKIGCTFLTGSWTYNRGGSLRSNLFHRVIARKLKWEPKKINLKRETRRGRRNSPISLYSSSLLSSQLSRQTRAETLATQATLRGGGGGGAYEWGRSSDRLRYTCLPFITGLFIWGLGTGLSETGTVSTDLLGSFALPGRGLGGDPTKVKSTLDTELWKNVVQFGTLGYFTSETKIVCFSTIWFKVRDNGQ